MSNVSYSNMRKVETPARRKRHMRNNYDEYQDEVHSPVSAVSALATSQSFLRQDSFLKLLDSLPENQAEALGLRVVLGLSLGEVADATGAPLNTVRSRIRLAKESLRKQLVEPSQKHNSRQEMKS